MKHTIQAILIALLASFMVSCSSTPVAKAEHEIVIETTIPTEYGDLTLVLWPEPDIKGELTFDIVNLEPKPGQ